MPAVRMALRKAVSAVIDRRHRARVCALFFCLIVSASASPNDRVFEKVVRQAKAAATAPYHSNETPLPDALQRLNYDTYRLITFRRNEGLWFGEPTQFQAQFFHPGYLYKQPVAINEVDGGKVRPVAFSPKFFRYRGFDPAPLANARLGFAGFRLLYPLTHQKPVDEIISFLGSSYFRALAAGQVYGISARALAVNTGENLTEEFPTFREFWLSRPGPDAGAMEFFALLDSPSVSGAYRFLIRPGAKTTVEIETRLFFRQAVQVLGLAPLTSMFWRDSPDPSAPNDKRPEVHDSDTLLFEDAAGEKSMLPLRQVDRITTKSFPETNPKGFGLLQRDRDPAHYRDNEAKYSRRPSIFVESLGDWGRGNVRLLQLPTSNEYNDNVVAFWQPEKSPSAGDEWEFKYRLHWFTQRSNKD